MFSVFCDVKTSDVTVGDDDVFSTPVIWGTINFVSTVTPSATQPKRSSEKHTAKEVIIILYFI